MGYEVSFDERADSIVLETVDELGIGKYEFRAEYSIYEDCVDLVLYKDGLEIFRQRDVMILKGFN